MSHTAQIPIECSGSKVFFNACGTKIALDCSGAENSFISHAHFDHAPSLSKAKKIISSKETIKLMKARGIIPEAAENSTHAEEFESGGLRARLLNAGHVLGSSMLFAQWDGASFLYTADFKTTDSLVTKKAEAVECDALLMEATYGHPDYKFPSREETYSQMAAWAFEQKAKGKIAVFGGYSLGKAQEIIKVLNEHCQITPIVSKHVAKVCGVYNEHGANLEYAEADSPEANSMLKGAFTAVLPHHQISRALSQTLSSQYKRQVATALATGWNAGSERLFGADRVFTLSDHCDFNELLEFAEATGAKKILTTHGFAKELAHALRKKGFNATAIEEMENEKTSLLAFAQPNC